MAVEWRNPGDPVPEAAGWRTRHVYLKRGDIEERDGSYFAKKRIKVQVDEATKTSPETPEPAPEPAAPPAPPLEPEFEPIDPHTEAELGKLTKRELAELAALELDLDVTGLRKAEMIAAILEAQA